MAYTRRSLTSSFTRLSRRFHPSFAHVLHDDRDSGESPRRRPIHTVPFPYQSLSFSRSVPAFGSPLRDGTGLGLRLPLGVDPFPRRYSSSSDGGLNEIECIKDVAEVLTDATIDAAATTATVVPVPFPGEVAAAAADSYLPVAALQYLIDGVHSFIGLNWFASIALTTVLIRGATVPLLLNQMRATVKLNMMRPELEELKQHMQNSMDPESIQEGQKRMKELFKKHGVTPFTPLKGIFIQGPVFISFFMAISNMVEKVPSFKGGGAFWFTDLTTPDPLYMLPVLTSLTFLATVELNMQEGMEGNPMAKTMKNFFRVLGLMTIPFTANFPKAIFGYWITSNIFSLVYGFVIKRPPVRKYLNLPDMLPQTTNPSPLPSFSLFGGPGSGSGSGSGSAAPTAPPLPDAKESEQFKSTDRRVSTSSVISQRIRNLEKSVKGRSKIKKR